MTGKINQRLLSTKQAMDYLNCSEWKIRQLVWAGELPVVRSCDNCNWFFDLRDLENYVERSKQVIRY